MCSEYAKSQSDLYYVYHLYSELVRPMNKNKITLNILQIIN